MPYGKVVYKDVVLIDLTADDIQEDDVKEGFSYHDCNGIARIGTRKSWLGNGVKIVQGNEYGYEAIIDHYDVEANTYDGNDLIIDLGGINI